MGAARVFQFLQELLTTTYLTHYTYLRAILEHTRYNKMRLSSHATQAPSLTPFPCFLMSGEWGLCLSPLGLHTYGAAIRSAGGGRPDDETSAMDAAAVPQTMPACNMSGFPQWKKCDWGAKLPSEIEWVSLIRCVTPTFSPEYLRVQGSHTLWLFDTTFHLKIAHFAVELLEKRSWERLDSIV